MRVGLYAYAAIILALGLLLVGPAFLAVIPGVALARLLVR